MFTDWKTNIPTGDYAAPIYSVTAQDNTLNGFSWNAIGIAGPGTAYNLIKNNVYSDGNRYLENTIDGIFSRNYAAGIYLNMSDNAEFKSNVVKNVYSTNPSKASGVLIETGTDSGFVAAGNSYQNVENTTCYTE